MIGKKVLLGCLAAALLLAGACTTTQMINQWQTATPPASPLVKIMVVGVSDNEINRRAFEDVFVSQFQAQGVSAVPSYQVLPSSKEKDPEKVRQAAASQGADGVLVAHYRGMSTRQQYMPPMTTPVVYRGFGTYYPYVYDYVTQPGYYVQRQFLCLETTLYQVSDGMLLWGGTSETLEPVSMKDLVDDLSVVVIKDLKSGGFVN